jgi:hypothetical protein
MVKTLDLENLRNVHVFSTPEYKKVVFGMLSASVYLDVWMHGSLARKRLDEFYSYSIFKSLYIIGRSPVNVIILAHYKGPKHKMSVFL